MEIDQAVANAAFSATMGVLYALLMVAAIGVCMYAAGWILAKVMEFTQKQINKLKNWLRMKRAGVLEVVD